MFTPLQKQEMQEAWQQVQFSHRGMLHADTDHWDIAVHLFNLAQSRYDSLVAEYVGVTPEKRRTMLAEVRSRGFFPGYFAPEMQNATTDGHR